MMKKIMVIAGLFLIFGTAGASDLDTISFGRAIVQCLIGFALVCGGAV